MLLRVILIRHYVWLLVLRRAIIIFVGANYHKTRFGNINYKSCHAEMNTLLQYLKLKYNLKSLKNIPKGITINNTIYVVRLMNHKEN